MDVCERTESEPGVDEEILMGLVQAERARNERACAVKKRAASRDARKIRAILSYTQYVEEQFRGHDT